MKVGSLTLQTARPVDLDEQLLATTGCSAAEIRGHLGGPCLAGAIAAALLPFVKGEKPVRHSLAEAIVEAGIDKIRQRVRAMYDAALSPKAKPEAGSNGQA